MHTLGNQTVSVKYKCDLTYPGTVRHVDKPHKSVRNVMITRAENITAFLGLCGGDAASFLGILNSGDCVGLELASKLTFSPRTLVRAYISYYRKSVDVLEKGTDVPINIRKLRERESGLEDKYYLQSIDYGTQEIIFVQFRFMTVEEAKKARGIQLESATMTDYMRRIRSSVGTPKIVTVISMSTSDPTSYKLESFDTLRTTPEAWNRTVRHVNIQERFMNETMRRIDKGYFKPHLKYRFSPFLEEKVVGFRTGNPMDWEQISMTEVRLRGDIDLAKRNSRKCRKINRGRYKALCRRVRHHRKMLVELKKEIHAQRTQWSKLEPATKQEVINRYRVRVAANSRFTKKLAKAVRKMRRVLKRERLMEKSKQRNQVPVSPARARPFRHPRQRGTMGGKGSRRGSMGNHHANGVSLVGIQGITGSKAAKGFSDQLQPKRPGTTQWKTRSKRKHFKGHRDTNGDPNLRFQGKPNHRRRRIRPRRINHHLRNESIME